MVLVDSSVWVDFFHGRQTPEAETLDELLQEELVCTCRLIMAEIIPGANTEKEFHLLKDYFNALPLLEDPPEFWEQVLDWRFNLKREGVDGIAIADLMIAVLAREHECPLLTRDRHFRLMRPIMGLELVGH